MQQSRMLKGSHLDSLMTCQLSRLVPRPLFVDRLSGAGQIFCCNASTMLSFVASSSCILAGCELWLVLCCPWPSTDLHGLRLTSVPSCSRRSNSQTRQSRPNNERRSAPSLYMLLLILRLQAFDMTAAAAAAAVTSDGHPTAELQP